MSYKKSLDVNYEEILQAQNDDSILIIDIREQSEIRKTGKLPGSIHIPMNDVCYILQNLSEEDFKKRYGKHKPTKNTRIIFSCQSGRRSATMQEETQKLGYKNVYNYKGGWLDWERKQRSFAS
ncbi:hypothetical protein HN011_002879 [Eciton burchellii]|nr:hypothetical protein HN011_002879 [Eciton burchellii]